MKNRLRGRLEKLAERLGHTFDERPDQPRAMGYRWQRHFRRLLARAERNELVTADEVATARAMIDAWENTTLMERANFSDFMGFVHRDVAEWEQHQRTITGREADKLYLSVAYNAPLRDAWSMLRWHIGVLKSAAISRLLDADLSILNLEELFAAADLPEQKLRVARKILEYQDPDRSRILEGDLLLRVMKADLPAIREEAWQKLLALNPSVWQLRRALGLPPRWSERAWKLLIQRRAEMTKPAWRTIKEQFPRFHSRARRELNRLRQEAPPEPRE